MSDAHQNHEEIRDSEPAPQKDRPGRSEDAPLKVVDRRFWARQEGAEAGAEAAETAPPSTRPKLVEELEARLRDTQARLHDVLVAVQKADKENDEFRERLRRDVERRVSLAKAGLFRDLLEVADNLERALAAAAVVPTATAAGALGASASSITSELSRGVGQVLSQLRRLLAAHGIEEIDVAGLPFDPEVAEAIEVREVSAVESDGHVIEITQRGYRFAGQTLRPARVVVAKAARTPPRSEGFPRAESES